MLSLSLSLSLPIARAAPDACPESSNDCFVDAAGQAVSAERAYRLLHRPPKPHYLLAVAEDLLFLGVGTTWYWIARDKNLVDWDRPSAKARFTLNVIRMDNNDFPINFTLHPWSGAAYYAAARTNGASFGVSALFAFGATMAWEYGIEFREKVSFNDLIFTPLPGITLGEFASRVALYVNRFPSKPSWLQRTLGALFGPLQAFSDVTTRHDPVVGGPADRLGLSASMHHAFRIHAGLALLDTDAGSSLLGDFGVDGAFVSVPAHLRPGRFRRVLHDADFVRMWLSSVHGQDQREFDSYADVSLFGLYEQQISSDARGGFFFLGTSLGYRYRRSLLTGFRDEVAATHLPGLALESALLFGGAKVLRLSYRLQPDFAGVRALSYPAWQAAHPGIEGKTVVQNHGYWYGFGVTSLLEASVSISALSFGGRVWFAIYNSTEGLDREQEELAADPRGVEHILDGESFLRLGLFDTGLALELSLLMRRRLSRYGGYESQLSMLRSSARLVFCF